MTATSPQQAVANGHAVHTYASGYCQKFVRDQCWRVPSLYGSAIEAWNGARYKHPGDRHPPAGAPCYYRGGNYGHAVIYCGQGHPGVRSTDCQHGGDVSDTDLGWPERAWGYTYLGWTEDINGVHVITPPAPVEEDPPYLSWPVGDQRALCADIVAALLRRDLYAQDPATEVTVGRALRQMEHAATEVLT